MSNSLAHPGSESPSEKLKITLYNMCAVPWGVLSTVGVYSTMGGAQYRGGVQYRGRYHEYRGGYLEYRGGYHDKCGGIS